jgi:hypothetical protein
VSTDRHGDGTGDPTESMVTVVVLELALVTVVTVVVVVVTAAARRAPTNVVKVVNVFSCFKMTSPSQAARPTPPPYKSWSISKVCTHIGHNSYCSTAQHWCRCPQQGSWARLGLQPSITYSEIS